MDKEKGLYVQEEAAVCAGIRTNGRDLVVQIAGEGDYKGKVHEVSILAHHFHDIDRRDY